MYNVCPVGALIDNRIAGKARAWETEKEEVKSLEMNMAAILNLAKKDGVVLGVRAKEPGEGRPLCLKVNYLLTQPIILNLWLH